MEWTSIARHARHRGMRHLNNKLKHSRQTNIITRSVQQKQTNDCYKTGDRMLKHGCSAIQRLKVFKMKILIQWSRIKITAK